MPSLSLIVILLLVVPLGLGAWAQARVRATFREADQIENAEHVTGHEAARHLLDQSGLQTVSVVVGDELGVGDAYDPTTKRLLITERTATRHTDLSVGIVGHEVGHAIQDAQGFPLLRVRDRLARWLVGLAWVSPIFLIGGFVFGIVPFMWLAVAIMGLEVVFALVTLPVELDASKRAVVLLEAGHVIVMSEERTVRKVLRAAAFTYLAAAGMHVAFFLFWFVVLLFSSGFGS